MEEIIKSSERYISNSLDKTKSQASWLDAHTDLLAKLESGYEISHETIEEISGVRHYGFNIGGLNILVPENVRCEVLEENIIYSVPLAPSWLIGACNVRGDIVPIIDLEHILTGRERSKISSQDKTCVIGNAENSIGLLLNQLPNSIHFNKENSINNFSNLPKIVQPFITSGYRRDEKDWVCIDFVSFFSTLAN